MVKALHNKRTQKMVWIVLAILILPAFVFWGINSTIREQKTPDFMGRISGQKVSFLEFREAIEATRNALTMQFGENIQGLEKILDLETRAWERLVLLHEANKRKIKVSDREIVAAIQKNPIFQKKGIFDKFTYDQTLKYVFRSQPRSFEEQTRQNLKIYKLFNLVTKDVGLQDEEIKEAYRKENEKISLEYIAGVPKELEKEATASDQELTDYYNKNTLDFKLPLSFNLEYLKFDSQDKVNNVFSRLEKGDGLPKIAKDLGLQITETGTFNQTDPIPGIGQSEQLTEMFSKVKQGQVMPPLIINEQHYIMLMKERQDAFIPDFETAKDRVKEVVLRNKAKDLAKERTEKALNKLKEVYIANPKALNFDNIASEFGLKSSSTELFKAEDYIKEIGKTDELFKQARQLKENEFSSLIDLPSGYYIIKVKSFILVDEKKFEEEKEVFTKSLLAQKKEDYFLGFLQDLKKQITK
ncbi:MAG: peptidylprolyl isomerase [Candidatus Omnitrophota bacterium]|nr:peptidylprolyl isomerase [Candidatus Omnitrophota bacterium]MBU1929796.1 peptidylprolyl isomerase [Candidatus Omnitrophota bacterium]MBU2035202.1 peptidylprolyl isomerase [Candidatus Omnitrophota bacterium]MBU2258509.1 peptidylprolyl isomerase [Candidatus Omnitrophota bacterium]